MMTTKDSTYKEGDIYKEAGQEWIRVLNENLEDLVKVLKEEIEKEGLELFLRGFATYVVYEELFDLWPLFKKESEKIAKEILKHEDFAFVVAYIGEEGKLYVMIYDGREKRLRVFDENYKEHDIKTFLKKALVGFLESRIFFKRLIFSKNIR